MANLAELQQRRAAYVAAELKVLQDGEEYGVSSGPDGGTNRRAKLEAIRAGIMQLDREIEQAEARASRSTRVRVGVPTW
jgi:hypothetical protein